MKKIKSNKIHIFKSSLPGNRADAENDPSWGRETAIPIILMQQLSSKRHHTNQYLYCWRSVKRKKKRALDFNSKRNLVLNILWCHLPFGHLFIWSPCDKWENSSVRFQFLCLLITLSCLQKLYWTNGENILQNNIFFKCKFKITVFPPVVAASCCFKLGSNYFPKSDLGKILIGKNYHWCICLLPTQNDNHFPCVCLCPVLNSEGFRKAWSALLLPSKSLPFLLMKIQW